MMDQKGVPPLLLNFGGQIFAILQNWQGYQLKHMALKYKNLLHTTILFLFFNYKLSLPSLVEVAV